MKSPETEKHEEGLLWEAIDAIDLAIIQLGVEEKYKSYEARRKYIGKVVEALDMYINRAGGR